MQFFNKKLNRIKRKKAHSIQPKPQGSCSIKNQIVSKFFSKVKNSLNLLQSGYEQRQRTPDQAELLKSLTRFKVPNRVKELALPKTIRMKINSANQSRIQLFSDKKTKRKQRSIAEQLKQKSKTISFTNTEYKFAKNISNLQKVQSQNKKQENYINSSKLGILSSIKILEQKERKQQVEFLLKQFLYSIAPKIQEEKPNMNQFQNHFVLKKLKRRKGSIYVPSNQNFDKKTSSKCCKLYQTIVSQNEYQNQEAYNSYHQALMQKKTYPSFRRKKSVAINVDYQWKK